MPRQNPQDSFVPDSFTPDSFTPDSFIPDSGIIDTTPTSVTMTMDPILQNKLDFPSFLDRITSPMIPKSTKGGVMDAMGALSDISMLALKEPSTIPSMAKGYAKGAMEGIMNFSPLDIASMAVAPFKGAKLLSNILSGTSAIAGAKHFSEGDRLTGAAEMLGGGVGMLPNTPKPKLINEIPNRGLALPAKGESSATTPRFFQGVAGVADANMQYPHNMGQGRPLDIIPDIGPELAASRTVGDIPFRHPQGKLKPVPKPDIDVSFSNIELPELKVAKDAMRAAIVEKTPIAKSNLASAIKETPKINWFSELWNFAKTAKTTGDVSAAFRQGGGGFLYKEYWKNFKTLFTNYGSQAAHDATMQNIRSNRYYDLGQQVKLQTTSLDDITNREEQIMSSIVSEGVPWFGKTAQSTWKNTAGAVVKASNRSYTGFLAKLRQDMFSSMVDDAKRMGIDPEKDPYYAGLIAKFVNSATGRSSLGALEKNAVELNNTMFSPRFLASRVQMMNPKNYGMPLPKTFEDVLKPGAYERMPPQIRHAYMRAAAGQVGLWISALGLARLAGAEVNFDPTSADFLKAKFGNVRLDPGQGFQQIAVMLSRLASNKYTSSTDPNNTYALGEGGPFGETSGSTVGRFAVNKSHPNLSPILNKMFFNRDISGTDYAPTPMMMEDAVKLMQTDPNLFPIIVPGALGIPIQVYEEGMGR